MFIYHCILWLGVLIKTALCNCSGGTSVLTASYTSAGTLQTDNYPSSYPNDANCQWLLQAADPGQRVVVYFEDFYTEENYDYLTIYDGSSIGNPLLFRDSGYDHAGTWVISSSQYMFLHFTSDYSVRYTGIQITYISTDSSVSAGCQPGPFTDPIGQINTIDYVSQCNYQITSNPNGRIRFSVLIKDVVEIKVYDGTSASDNLIVEYYDLSSDANVYQSQSTNIYVEKSCCGKFIMYYEAVNESATIPTNPVVQPTTPTYEYSCSGNQITAQPFYEHISTPNYPNNYPNNLDCDVTITAENTSFSIEFIIVDVQLLYCCDYVEIFDGPDPTYNTLGITWSAGDTRISSGSSIHIKFHSDSSGSLQGALLDFREVPREIPSCLPASYTSIYANDAEQVILSPNYPDYYNDNMEIYWLITKPSETETIVLDIVDIHIEYSSECVYDRLVIYDGACTDAPYIAVICGSEQQVLKDSSGLYVLIEFQTDYSVTYRGFKMDVYMGAADEDDKKDRNLLYIIGIVIAGTVVITVIVCAFTMHKKCMRSSHVTPRSPTALVPPTTESKPKHITQHQLFVDVQTRYHASQEKVKGLKQKRKNVEKYQSLQDPSGITTISHPSPYPPPQPPFGIPPPSYIGQVSDPAHPTNLFEISAKEAQLAPKPALVPRSSMEEPTFTPDNSYLPNPSTYLSPAEARVAESYR